MSKGRKIYYTTSQICEEFDLPASTIRFWEKTFKCFSPRKNAKGTRYYTSEDLLNFKLIYYLVKEKKMTLAGAESHLMQRKTAAKSEMSVVDILNKIKSTLLEIKQEIETIEIEEKKKNDVGQKAAIVIKNSEEMEGNLEQEDTERFVQLELF